MPPFQTVGIIGKQGDPDKVRATLQTLRSYLESQGICVLLDAESAHLLDAGVGMAVPTDELGARCDLIVVVGGDGTLLHAARVMAPHGVPLVGINLGRVGFLVDVLPQDIVPVMGQILAGEFDADSRSMLQMHVIADQTPGHRYAALNDVVIHKWNTARMIEFETYIDNRFIYAQRSDGLIISTPTGSTAYALSGGGPLLDPALDAIVLVPICPHDLSNRPLVIPGTRHIEVRVRQPDCGQVQVTCDGQTELQLPSEARVQISRHPDRVYLLHPKDHNHYHILRAKLGWGSHLRATRR